MELGRLCRSRILHHNHVPVVKSWVNEFKVKPGTRQWPKHSKNWKGRNRKSEARSKVKFWSYASGFLEMAKSPQRLKWNCMSPEWSWLFQEMYMKMVTSFKYLTVKKSDLMPCLTGWLSAGNNLEVPLNQFQEKIFKLSNNEPGITVRMLED